MSHSSVVVTFPGGNKHTHTHINNNRWFEGNDDFTSPPSSSESWVVRGHVEDWRASLTLLLVQSPKLKQLWTLITEIKIHHGNNAGCPTEDWCPCRAPGMSPPGCARASRGAAASPEGHHQQTPAAQLSGHPQHGRDSDRHSQRWAGRTRSPSGACAHSSGRKTFLGDSSTSPLLCFLSLSKSLSRLDIFISWTWDITTSSQLSPECSWLAFLCQAGFSKQNFQTPNVENRS